MLGLLQALVVAAEVCGNGKAKAAAEALLVVQYGEVMAQFLPSVGGLLKSLDGFDLGGS